MSEIIKISIVSGTVQGEEQILDAMHEAITDAFVVGTKQGWKLLEPEVALDKGAMRRNMRIKLRAYVSREIKNQRMIYEIDKEDVRRILIGALSYAKYHVREGVYFNPTTGGTMPITRAQLDKLIKYIQQYINLSLSRHYRLQGLEPL